MAKCCCKVPVAKDAACGQGYIQGHRLIGRLPRSREADAGIMAPQEAHQIYG